MQKDPTSAFIYANSCGSWCCSVAVLLVRRTRSNLLFLTAASPIFRRDAGLWTWNHSSCLLRPSSSSVSETHFLSSPLKSKTGSLAHSGKYNAANETSIYATRVRLYLWVSAWWCEALFHITSHEEFRHSLYPTWLRRRELMRTNCTPHLGFSNV